MNSKWVLILVVLAAVVVGAAAWLSGERKAVTEAAAGGALIAGLKDQINAVNRVVIDDGTDQVELQLGEAGWSVSQRAGFTADIGQIRRRLLALADAQRMEKKTANAENYSVLGVSDVAADDNDDKNRLVSIDGPDKAVALIIGKTANGGKGTYVRAADSEQSWLVSGDLTFSTNVTDWIKKDIIDLGASRIRRVTLTHQDKPEVVIEKGWAEAPNFDIGNLPEGREPVSPSAGNSIASALGSLRVDDVLPADKVDFQGVDIVQGVFETFDGLRVDTRTWEKGDKRYVILSVRYDPALVVMPDAGDFATEDTSAPSGEATDESTAPETATPLEPTPEELAAQAATAAAVEAEAGALASLVDGWAFEIPSYKYSNLSKNLEELLKPLADD